MAKFESDNDPGQASNERFTEDAETKSTEPLDNEFSDLMAKAKEGDSNAVGMLVDGNRNYLLLIANEEFGKELRAKMGASDIVQESMLRAQDKLEQFRGSSENDWRSWLRTILLNDVARQKRGFPAKKRNAKQEFNLQENFGIAANLVDQQLTPSNRFTNAFRKFEQNVEYAELVEKKFRTAKRIQSANANELEILSKNSRVQSLFENDEFKSWLQKR